MRPFGASFYTRCVSAPRKMRIGLLGGTFDPPHFGHLAAAEVTKTQVALDEVWFVVAHDPWQKSDSRAVTPAEVRLEMVRAAIEGTAEYVADDREIRRGGITYTADTLEEIHRERDDVEVYLIVGQDTAAKIHSTWHRPEVVCALSTLVVVTRSGTPFDASVVPANSIFVSMNPVDVSSSVVREAVAHGEDIQSLTPLGVRRVIEAHGLYRGVQ